MTRCAFAAAILLLARTSDAGQSPAVDTRTHAIDRLPADTRVVLTLRDGQVLTRFFRAASPDDITVATRRSTDRRAAGVITLRKDAISTIATHDPVRDGAGKGAVLGAAATLPLVVASVSACGKGCVRGSALAIGAGAALLGAGIGSLVGIAADLDAGGSRIVFPSPRPAGAVPPNGFFATSPNVRVRAMYGGAAFYRSTLTGPAAARGLGVAVQISPHLSLHTEYVAIDHTFYPAPGAVSDDVLRNVVGAPVRIAGWARGIERRRVSYALSELAAFHLSPWRRLRLGLIAGVGVAAEERRDYYDAYERIGPNGETRALPGKYYVLDFESPAVAVVAGVDAEIALSRRLAIVPAVRHHQRDNPGPQFSFAIAAQWRF